MNLILKDFPDNLVCVVGLGYVGLTLATVMADVGFQVLGIEIREEVLNKLACGEPHFHEPGLTEKLRRLVKKELIRFSKHIPVDWHGNVYIITVGTPLNKEKKPRLDMIEHATKEVEEHLKCGDLVIMRSTVKPGTTRQVVMPILARKNVPFDLAFCPERTLEGIALTELRHLPQIVGGSTESAAIRASRIFQYLTQTVIRVSDIETAEMIKLVDNAQRDVMFAYANEIARACDVLGISATEVIESGKLGYERTKLAAPGLVGGPCLEKDSYILAEGLMEHGLEPEITLQARKINERQPSEVISYLANICKKIGNFPETPKISLLGLAFKGRPETDDLRGTMAKNVLLTLKQFFPAAYYYGYDAIVSEAEIKNFGVAYSPTIELLFRKANIVLILNNHPIFSNMPLEELAFLLAEPAIIYDFWNLFRASNLKLPRHVGYISLGSHGRGIYPYRNKKYEKEIFNNGSDGLHWLSDREKIVD